MLQPRKVVVGLRTYSGWTKSVRTLQKPYGMNRFPNVKTSQDLDFNHGFILWCEKRILQPSIGGSVGGSVLLRFSGVAIEDKGVVPRFLPHVSHG